MNKENQQINFIIDSVGLVLIGLFSLGYCLFWSRFAELHLNISFLDFPIFIGEILFFLCLALLIVKWIINNQKFNIWHYFIFCYLGFVILKAFLGYSKWGPLAFRHSALFYYPMFAVFGYSFYRRDFFSNKMILFLIALLILILGFIPFYRYFMISCFIVTLILIRACKHNIIRNISICMLLIATPYGLYFHSSRTVLVAGLVTLIYLLIAFIFLFELKQKLIISTFCIAFILFGVSNVADNIAVKSIVNLKEIVNIYNKLNEKIMESGKDFKITNIKEVKLYNPDVERDAKIEVAKAKVREIEKQMKKERPYSRGIMQINLVQEEISLGVETLKARTNKLSKKIGLYPTIEMQGELSKIEEVYTNIEKIKGEIENKRPSMEENKGEIENKRSIDQIEEQIQKLQGTVIEIETRIEKKTLPRKLHTDYGNSVLRLFIWRDMLKQMKEGKSIIGIDFGRPFRSKSIEILGFACGEWSRDGWIAAHNSYLEIIYRTGVFGILFVAIIFTVLLKMIKISISIRSINGILLCGILINWLIAANFAVILELPYNAIPFWSIFGITFCYLNFKAKGKELL